MVAASQAAKPTPQIATKYMEANPKEEPSFTARSYTMSDFKQGAQRQADHQPVQYSSETQHARTATNYQVQYQQQYPS